MNNQKAKLKRAAKLTQILSKYGFEDIKAKLENKQPNSPQEPLQRMEEQQQIAFYQRIRKAIEELGPTYIKFGQTLSTREDLLPPLLIKELKQLQDNVPAEDIDLLQLIAGELQLNAEDYFREINTVPLASASIAQAYKATLQNGEQVILKVKRPGIRDIVHADLLLMKDIISLLHDYYSVVKEINLKHVFDAFAKNLYEELSFTNELHNIEQFRRNFRDDSRIQTMKAYPELSNDSILCIQFIEGVKINDIKGLQAYHLDTEKVLDNCFQLFLTQILEHGFFHADPHPGNILVTPKGKIAFIDLGAMAKMLPKDKEILEDFIVYFINKDATRLISTIKRMAIHSEIANEKMVERAIEEMLEIIGNRSLQEIDIKSLFSNFSHLLNANNVIMPEHIYLLVKGIVLMEGIGRELNPSINIVDKVKPYIKKISAERLSPEKLFENSIGTLWELKRMLTSAPQTVSSMVDKLNDGSFQITVDNKDIQQLRKQEKRNNSLNRLVALFGITFLGGCLLADVNQPALGGISITSWILFTLSLLILLVMLLKKLKLP